MFHVKHRQTLVRQRFPLAVALRTEAATPAGPPNTNSVKNEIFG